MQIVILAAGKSSRFFPLADKDIKDMLPIMSKPILEYVILSVKKAGFKEIILVVSPASKVKNYFDSGKKWGVNIKYVEQKQPLGQANAILSARNLLKEEKFFVINSQHVNFDHFFQDMVNFQSKKKSDFTFLGKETKDPSKLGMYKLEGTKVVGFVEKPKAWNQKQKIGLVGIYFLNQEFLHFLAKQPTEEYQLEVAIDKYVKNHNCHVLTTKKTCLTLKYPWDLFKIKDFLLHEEKPRICKSARIKKTVVIEGNVIIEDGARIYHYATILGPCYIGKNASVGSYCQIRDGTVLEEGVEIQRFADVKNSLVGKNTHLHSGFLGDSILAEDIHIGANFTSANLRLDRGEISSEVKGEKVKTGLKNFGTVIGHSTKIGINVATMPGKFIGSNCLIGPSQNISKNIPSNTSLLK
jgi:bifunctional UDP-N-acetylglucosamine pyrophosphorylase/glucosamine-1-phosphate N-acetyltransferase